MLRAVNVGGTGKLAMAEIKPPAIGRAIHIVDHDGMDRPELKLAGLSKGTARNLNTFRKLEAVSGRLVAGSPALR